LEQLAVKNQQKTTPKIPAASEEPIILNSSQLSNPIQNPAVSSQGLTEIANSLSKIVDSLKKLEQNAGVINSQNLQTELAISSLSEDLKHFNTWRKVKREVISVSILNGLKNRTTQKYMHILTRLEKANFSPVDLANRHGFKKIMKWVQSLDCKAKNIYLSAIRKAAKTCFPGAPVSFARLKLIPSKKIWPTYEQTILKIQQMIDKKEFNLALTSIFLMITGLRIHEATKLKLKDFGDELFIKDFKQEKTEKPRPFVILTKEFCDWAKKYNWEKVPWKHSFLAKKLKQYDLCCHAFRHIFITQRTKFVNSGLSDTSKMIGHSSEKITRLYLIADVNEEKKIIEKAFKLNLKF